MPSCGSIKFKLVFIVLLVTLAVFSLALRNAVRVLRPVCPGIHYPADPRELYTAVTQYLNDAQVEPRQGRLVGIIAPCAPYPVSGAVMAHAFKLVKPGQYDRVIILTPSHYATFQGCSIASVEYYRTPLGDVPVDIDAIRTLAWNSEFNVRSVIYRRDVYRQGERAPIHEIEHGIEIQLPFLQVQLGEFSLVPIVVGTFLDRANQIDDNALGIVVRHIQKLITDRTLLIVSTNLTRYGPQFGFVPFKQDVARELTKLDMELLNLLLERDSRQLQEYVSRTQNKFVGITPLIIFLNALPADARGTVLAYDSTGRIRNNFGDSVSFASLVFFIPHESPPEQKPVKTLTLSPQEKPQPEQPSTPTSPQENTE